MRLALVYPPFFAEPFHENLPTVDDELGLFPHISVGWAARGAKAAGWDVVEPSEPVIQLGKAVGA